MFRASLCPLSGATTAVAISGLPARPRPIALLSISSDGKPEAAAAAADVASDDGHVDARNMLSCI